ncbi:hypothetical protein ACRYCC_25575 [Actinomadura scrupuli]|uniref:sialidase family protein n=1 Tax=Actinomadura scrupuli TaxID=559629 RepID=UPI003D96D14E
MRRSAGVWRVASPSGPPALLNDIVALSPDEAWAVGQTSDHPVIQHWDGTTWSAVTPPRPASLIGAGLLGVAAVSPSAALAVGGGYDRLAGQEVPLIQRWNGTNWAAQDPGPWLRSGYVLTSVAMFTADEAWAVGHALPGGPIALRWDGAQWIRIPAPGPDRGRLLAVAGIAPDDVWAVGTTGSGALIMHFDGRAWRRERCPSGRSSLTDVVALPDGSAWAAGGDGLLHWNGRRWRRVDPGLGSVNTLAALSPTEVWAAGGRGELARFDGEKWHRADSPAPLDGAAVWLGAASVAPDTVWMVGSQRTGGSGGSATLHSVTALTQED